MMRALIPALAALAAWGPASAADLGSIVDQHILPAFSTLDTTAKSLDGAAQAECAPGDAALRAAYHDAYDAWMAASHLQIGPLETGELGFALSFWPDPRGKTAKTLRRFVLQEDAIVETPAEYATVSVAARGFPALERMLYDDALQSVGTEAYRCKLTRAIAADIAATSGKILAAWGDEHGALMRSAGASGNAIYPKAEDAERKLYTALMTALEFNAEARVARPLGTVDRPRPRRAEAWRSGRALKNLRLSTLALKDLAARLAPDGRTDVAEPVDAAFEKTMGRIDGLGMPDFDAGGDNQRWLEIDLLRLEIVKTRNSADEFLGKALGVFVGFNARDGD